MELGDRDLSEELSCDHGQAWEAEPFINILRRDRDGWTLLTLQRSRTRISTYTRMRTHPRAHAHSHTQPYTAIRQGKAAVFPSKGQLGS